MKNRVKHFLLVGVSWFLIVIGVVLLISPIPIGVFFIACGLSSLIYSSDTVAHRIANYRGCHAKLDEQLNWVERKLNNRVSFVSDALAKTRPIVDEDNGRPL